MKLEDQISVLNEIILDGRFAIKSNNPTLPDVGGHLVLQKQVKSHDTFPALKQFTNTLWYVNNLEKQPVFVHEYKDRVVGDNDVTALNKMEKQFFKSLTEWLLTGELDEIVKGTWKNEIQ